MKPRITLDFDGVVHSYVTPWERADIIPDPPVGRAFDAIEEYLDAGMNVAILSTRSHYRPTRDNSSSGINAMKDWFVEHGFKRVNELEFSTEKLPSLMYVDDRGWRFDGFFPSPDLVKALTPWNK